MSLITTSLVAIMFLSYASAVHSFFPIHLCMPYRTCMVPGGWQGEDSINVLAECNGMLMQFGWGGPWEERTLDSGTAAYGAILYFKVGYDLRVPHISSSTILPGELPASPCTLPVIGELVSSWGSPFHFRQLHVWISFPLSWPRDSHLLSPQLRLL